MQDLLPLRLFNMATTLKAFFRMVDACFKTESVATSVTGVVVVIVSLFTDYTVSKPNIPGALRWMTYLNVRSQIAITGLRHGAHG
jgi:ATP-binding cassette subfamily G (WHITE) protein 2 (SNQ2)